MASRDKKGKIMTKTEKIKELMSMKNEDVEFSGVLADADDVEALRRSEEADERQLRKMDTGWTDED
ncbi:YfhD family protein [Paenibacillus cellulositrophicus]|uniref:YfhD family protein n=3 Tax=Paenibacillus TaxID=44249 RepID=A0A1R1EU59_9BACL|nr:MULTISPECIES: YfhD family protein [Paenibacillus]MBJ9988124.1 YfhD family protein [Paenibacillus sp. S28]MCM2999712.1 YfhD family protein [Paenibacillus cellulositrophicus]MEC0179693.1 YfhD family protein [Paenibacillus favisporus]OMF55386.1 YfhD family protein [Paenibacillus rhizosphaerae]OXL84971.1 YfhD family protein [Paenibacillus sp. SSG-1]